jgi:hypothetical protein
MKTNYLFPHRLKLISGLVFTLSVIMYIVNLATDYNETFKLEASVFAILSGGFQEENVVFGIIRDNIVDEIIMLFIISSGLIFAFSKEKQEDELVSNIRLHSLAWATIANYCILLFCYLFIYGFPFLNVLMVAMFSQLLIFIILFRYRMYRFYNTRQNEE